MAAAPGHAPAGRSAPVGAPAGGGVPDGWLRARLWARLRCGRTVDALIVVGLVAWSLAGSRWGDAPTSHSSWGYVFGVLLPLPLLSRRRHPVPVLLAICAIAVGELLADSPVTAVAAVLVALYSVGAHSDSRRSRVVAAVVSEAEVVLATWRWAPPDHRLATALLLTGTSLGSLVLGVYVRTRRAYLAALLERTHTAERDRDQRALLAAAEERRRIAREMHDIVAHSVAVMVALSDGAAATALRDPNAAREASQQASATGRQALGEMHRLLGVLRDGDPDELAPQPTLAQLGDLLTRVRAAGLHVELVEVGTRPTLPPSTELAAYRLVQESLTNIVKHGREVTHITVSLRYRAAGVDLTVDDDGRPHHRLVVTEPAGHGLVGMRERLTAVNGTLDAGPRADGGWRVSARLPSTSAALPPDQLSAAPPVGSVA